MPESSTLEPLSATAIKSTVDIIILDYTVNIGNKMQ
jgi:hypothetical protein